MISIGRHYQRFLKKAVLAHAKANAIACNSGSELEIKS
jgi:hypothetical protein